MTPREALSNRERIVTVANGWVMLPLLLLLILGDIGLFIYAIAAGKADQPLVLPLVASLLLLPALIILMTGLFTLQPNEARVLVLFGAYKGTVRTAGFHWGNPFYSGGGTSPAARVAAVQAAVKGDTAAVVRLRRNKISLRARTYNSPA